MYSENPVDYAVYSDGQQAFMAKLEADEPIFILRARDLLSEEVIGFWLDLAEMQGVNKDKTAQASAHLEAFRHWQRDNAEKVRLPD